MTAAAGPTASAAQFGRSVWIWPIAGALLAAWPVWRSFFPEAPEFQAAGVPVQGVAAVAEIALCVSWIARYRQRIAGFQLPLFALGLALIVLAMAGADGDPSAADLAGLAICWLAATLLFAGAVLLDGQRAFAAAQGGAVPQVRLLARAHGRIGYWLFGVALAAATIQGTPQSYLLAALAVASPGAVLIWAALCDTARTVLAQRRVLVADFAALPALADCRAVIFAEGSMLIADRPKVVVILPAADAKPGAIVAVAAALLADDGTDAARAVQDFGVAHRVRVPVVKPLEASASVLRRGRLPDGRVMEIGALEAGAVGEDERTPFAEQIARAAELHRTVLALMETEPAPRLLGLLVLAKVARPGAAEAVRWLRKSGRAAILPNADVPPQDKDALAGLGLDDAVSSFPRPALGIVRPGEAPLELAQCTIYLGGRAHRCQEDQADIVVARDDPRTVADLLQFARDFRVRMRAAIALSNLPGFALLAGAMGYVPASPLLITGAALAGIALAVATPQALRLSSTIANEVDEE
jgi:cation transport ATPase